VLVRGLPVRNSAGQITSWVGINLDITQRKLAEEELRQHRDYLEELVRSRTLELMISNEELRHDIEQREKVEEALRILQENLEEQVKARTAELAAANRELEAFSYSVSHDLRAPLRHIVGFVQLLQKQAHDRLEESSRRHLEVIAQAANRMGKLIDDLLQFSRMGRSAMRVLPVSVASVVEDIRQEFQTDLNGTSVEWIISPELPRVQADPALLRVVLGNLLSNALKYSRKREVARIEIGCIEEGDDQVTIFVRDNGVGFDMQYADRLFGVFQRLHKAEEFEGTGIGLAIVQRIVHRHGGRIWAEGAPDGGATFYFSLPRGKELDARVEAHSAGRR
jgi:light-regulated signal transduction histidine kinase (bacteriophytochrome)